MTDKPTRFERKLEALAQELHASGTTPHALPAAPGSVFDLLARMSSQLDEILAELAELRGRLK
ncbi:MAG: hypothetical protein ACM358_17050 [Gemmatimonadota bacterium]